MKIAVLIMAAGQASRFGRCKQLAEIAGQPLVQHAINSAYAVCPDDVFVVSGAWHQVLSEAMEARRLHSAQLFYARHWAAGLGHSIAEGVCQIADQYEGILILLADQVAVSSDDLQRLVDRFTGHNIVCAGYQGKRGVPAIFNKACFPKLMGLTGDRGAQKLLYAKDQAVVVCPMESAAVDIDTEEDREIFLL